MNIMNTFATFLPSSFFFLFVFFALSFCLLLLFFFPSFFPFCFFLFVFIYKKKKKQTIVIDFDILTSAPVILNASGAGDVLSCFTALEDWRLAAEHGHDDFDQALLQVRKT